MTLGNATADLCTHLVCGFAAVRNGSLVPERPEDASEYDRLVALKLANPALKVMLSLGANGKDGVFSAVITTKARRRRYTDFINLMSYDYHMYQPYLPFTGHNSPLLKRNVEKSIFATLHVNENILDMSQKIIQRNMFTA
ncbi:hypothetical protein V5799_032661 [Amblyomma americanum]|uniref:GH18 domain-containing protein n=1 Tax=Amblyomma americanum TaxID=6943 RepID=A0AAQ4DQI7_AMBAM